MYEIVGEPLMAIIAKAIDFIIHYLLPYRVRLHLFAMEVREAARAMPPAIYMCQADIDGFMGQIDSLRGYYRLEASDEAA